MFKKIVLVSLFVLFAAVLIAGAVNRTADKSDTLSATGSQGQSADRHTVVSAGNQESLGRQAGQGNQGQGTGTGRNQESNNSEPAAGQGGQGQGVPASQQGANGSGSRGQGQGWRRQENQQAVAQGTLERITLQGIVLQAPAAGVDLILETAESEVLVGTGPGYLAEQGFALIVGDSISVTGSWENEEFKAMEITHNTNGETIILRDERGRPMWSGAGRNAQNSS